MCLHFINSRVSTQLQYSWETWPPKAPWGQRTLNNHCIEFPGQRPLWLLRFDTELLLRVLCFSVYCICKFVSQDTISLLYINPLLSFLSWFNQNAFQWAVYMKYVHFSVITNPKKAQGQRKLTANLRMDFPLRWMSLLQCCYHKHQLSGRNIPWETHKPLPPCLEQTVETAQEQWQLPLLLPSSHQPSSAHGLGHAHGNFGFQVHKEFRPPKFISPGTLGPVLGTSVQEENKKSQGCSRRPCENKLRAPLAGKGRLDRKSKQNTQKTEQTSALLFDGESILHPAGGYKFLHF